MAPKYPFGNDPAKIDGYKAFWKRENEKPLVGFSYIGWFPVEYFTACKNWKVNDHVTPDMIDPEEWLADQERLLEEGDDIEDDILRGACPSQVAFPCFLPAALGTKIRVLPDTVIGEEQKLSWDQALQANMDLQNPWVQKYVDFTRALVKRADGRYPVSHGAELGPTDLHAILRGHNESLVDLLDEPEKSSELLWKLGHIFKDFTELAWKEIPLYHDGYFDSQYQLWAPGPIIRMQEDATAVFSPDLYRKFVQPIDKMLAAHFPNNFIHLHSTSMYLLDAFLEIEDLRCLEINIEAFNIPVKDMIKYYHVVQKADRSLLIRGSVTPDEMRLLLDELEPQGLYLHLVVESKEEIDSLQSALEM